LAKIKSSWHIGVFLVLAINLSWVPLGLSQEETDNLQNEQNQNRVIIYAGPVFNIINLHQFEGRLDRHGLQNFIQPIGGQIDFGWMKLAGWGNRETLILKGAVSYTSMRSANDDKYAQFSMAQAMVQIGFVDDPPGHGVWVTDWGVLGVGGGGWKYDLHAPPFSGAESAGYLAIEPELGLTLGIGNYFVVNMFGGYHVNLASIPGRRSGDWRDDDFHHPDLNYFLIGLNIGIQF